MLFVIKSEACGLSYENRRTFLVRRFSFFSRLDLDQIFCETRVDRCGVVQDKKHKDFLLKQAKEALAESLKIDTSALSSDKAAAVIVENL